VSGSGKSGIRPFFGNPAKSGSDQITSRIWRMPVQLHYVQIIRDKTNADDLSAGVFAILISVTRSIKIQNSLPFNNVLSKTGKQWRNKGSTELYCLFIAADSMLMSLVSWAVLSCDPKTSSPQIRIWLWLDLSSYIRPGPAPFRFEIVRSCATLRYYDYHIHILSVVWCCWLEWQINQHSPWLTAAVEIMSQFTASDCWKKTYRISK